MKPLAKDEIDPLAFVNLAATYLAAANELRVAPSSSRLDPQYFLYFHAVELALKGFLRAHGVPTSELRAVGHKLRVLLERCQAHGFRGADDQELARQNVLTLLDDANVSQGLRYFTLPSRTMPDVEWTREVVTDLVGDVQASLFQLNSATSAQPAIKVELTVGKPKERDG